MYADKLRGKVAQARGERTLELALSTSWGLIDCGQPRALWALGDLMVWDILSETRRGQISRLVREYRGSGYPSSALSIDKYVLCGKKKKINKTQ